MNASIEENKRALHYSLRLSALHYDMSGLQTFPVVSSFEFPNPEM